MAAQTVLARWYKKSNFYVEGGVNRIQKQKTFSSIREAAVFIVEKVGEIDRVSAEIILTGGRVLRVDDIQQIYKKHKGSN